MLKSASQDHAFRDELRIIAAVFQNIPDGGGGDVGEFLGGRNDNRFNLGGEAPVSICDGPFSLEINHIPYPTDYVTNTELAIRPLFRQSPDG